MPLHHRVLNEVPTPVQLDSEISELSGFALNDAAGQAYDEAAFHYFLEIERKRAEIWNRPFLMMLIDFRRNPEISPRIDEPAAGRLFSILLQCIRETDFVGWYREGRVA